jgi:hypothetical protein
MELLRQILEGLVVGFQVLVDLLSPLIASIVSAIFDVEVSPDAAHGFTTVLLVLVGAWAIGKAFNGVTKSPASQPMKVEHYTTKTPAQVVGEDRWGKVKTLLIIGAVLLTFYFIGDVAVP